MSRVALALFAAVGVRLWGGHNTSSATPVPGIGSLSSQIILPENILEVCNLNAYYEKTQALKDVNLHIPRGKVTALIGPSGCGKSTLIRSLNRMNEAMDKEGTFRHTGQINLIEDNGMPLDINGRTVDVTSLRRMIGMVFQKSIPFPKTIYENVAFIPRLDGMREKELDDIVENALKKAALWDEVKDDLKRKLGTELSGGQQQRLCIARALASDPDILLMDEPCSALDPQSTKKIEDLIYELSKTGTTVVIVTHNMEQARRVSDQTAFFYIGELIEVGPTDKIFTNPEKKQTEDYVTGKFG